jgi:hypothetical protein
VVEGLDSDSKEFDQPALQALIMSIMVTTCPGCGQSAELGEGCDLSVMACSKQGCAMRNW